MQKSSVFAQIPQFFHLHPPISALFPHADFSPFPAFLSPHSRPAFPWKPPLHPRGNLPIGNYSIGYRQVYRQAVFVWYIFPIKLKCRVGHQPMSFGSAHHRFDSLFGVPAKSKILWGPLCKYHLLLRREARIASLLRREARTASLNQMTLGYLCPFPLKLGSRGNTGGKLPPLHSPCPLLQSIMEHQT